MPTVNDPLHPEWIRHLVERLQEAVSSVAGREAALYRDHAASLLAAKRRSTATREAESMGRSARQTALIEECDQEQAAAAAKYHQRCQRISAAAQAAHGSLARRVREEKDRQVGRRQAESVRTRKEAKETWERARQDHREFAEKVAADGDEIRILAAEALKVLRSFRPWFSGMIRKGRMTAVPEPDRSQSREALRARGREEIEAAYAQLEVLKGRFLARVFRIAPPSLLLALIAAGFGIAIFRSPERAAAFAAMKIPLLVALLVPLVAYLLTALSLWTAVRKMARFLQAARRHGAAAVAVSEAQVEALGASLKKDLADQSSGISETLRDSEEFAQHLMHEGRQKIEAQLARLPAKAEALYKRGLTKVARRLEQGVAGNDRTGNEEHALREAEHVKRIAEADAVRAEGLKHLLAEWDAEVKPLHRELTGLAAIAAGRFPAWDESWIASWTPPFSSEHVVPFGRLVVSLETLAGGIPEDGQFTLDGPPDCEVPFALGFPDRASLWIEGDAAKAAETINEIILRLLSSHPAGRAVFTLIDPVGLGRDFAGLMHLGDYEESLIHGRIWTQTTQIEERLAELNEHIEKVIQMYLRNEFPTLDDYNAHAGTVAEKHRFVVISGFPAAFSETAAKRLLSIATSGARCGVYLLLHSDGRQAVPDPALAEALDRACLRLVEEEGGYRVAGMPAGADRLEPVKPPQGPLETALVHRLGKASVDSNRVEVPFAGIAPHPGEWWTSSTAAELRVPIGRSGAKKFQWLALGKGTRQHVLVAGKTGSGKSTLFHVMITNLALHCSPDEVEFYLVDFKKGVEFKCYGTHRLPHARVIAIESDREFGLSVLHRVDDELRRRGELFRKHGSQDLAGYREASGELLPRTLLLIDEFQEFFTEEDAVAQSASLLLDRIVRQGRAFGIHVILGSQTLGGAYTLARATLGQMVVRIALQCNEADAYLIMDDDNPAPRLLTRPGEGIYNDNAGALAANSPFQAVWLSEEERNGYLERITELAGEGSRKIAAPVVFEGNAPAELASNPALEVLIASPPLVRPAEAKAWLGEPNSIKGPTEASFARRSGSHLLAIGQAEERVSSLLSLALLSIATGHPAGDARFIVLDSARPQGIAASVKAVLPHEVRVAGPAGIAEVFSDLAAELEKRANDGAGGPDIFVVIHGLQRFKKLRQEDDLLFSMDEPAGPNPAKVLADLASAGAALGIHLLIGVDTWNNVSRWLPRKIMAEFEMRVLFQMSANDSANLIDSPAAGSLGLHRALLYNETQGTVETFRPYAEPDPAWWSGFSTAMKSREMGVR